MNFMSMTPQELDNEIKTSFAKEDAQIYQTLCILKAIYVNRSFEEFGHPSLYQYLKEECKRDGGSAQRRIDAMRLMMNDTVIEDKIKTGELSFTNAAFIGNTIRNVDATPEQAREIVLSSLNQTAAATREVLISHFPEIDLAVEMKFSVPKEYAAMFKELNGMLAHENKRKTKLGLFLRLIEKEHAAQMKKRTPPVKKTLAEKPKTTSSPETKKRLSPRAIARRISTFRFLLARANNHCQHPKCKSNYGLERDHIIRLANGGTDTLGNLQLLCEAHHNRKSRAEGKATTQKDDGHLRASTADGGTCSAHQRD